MQELLNVLNTTKNTLDKYYDIHKDEDFSSKRNGFNIGEEFSGRHPAVVLKNGGKTLLVLPITSKQPTEKQLASKTYVELSKIYNFKSMRRWVNIFNINPISIERIDFSKKKGNIKGIDLDNISKAFLDSDLFKYKPAKNNL